MFKDVPKLKYDNPVKLPCDASSQQALVHTQSSLAHMYSTCPLPLQSCDRGDPPLCRPAGEREGAGDTEE